MKNHLLLAALACAVLVGPAAAAPISFDTAGVWASASPDPLGSPNTLTGLGTKDLKWGVPVGSDRSGYTFVGRHDTIADVAALLATSHVVGALVHFNYPIETVPGAIDSAVLNLTVKVADAVLNLPLLFHHNETVNEQDPCPVVGGPPPVGGCPDVVSLPDAAYHGQMNIAGEWYDVRLSGFLQNGNVVTQFITKENNLNTAGLLATFTPAVSVPEPGGALLVGLGLLGLWGVRRSAQS